MLKLGEAITSAIDECIEKEILLDILTEERAEVFMYILESFNKELYERDLKENALAEGLKIIIKKKLAKGKSLEQIANDLETDVISIERLIKEME